MGTSLSFPVTAVAAPAQMTFIGQWAPGYQYDITQVISGQGYSVSFTISGKDQPKPTRRTNVGQGRRGEESGCACLDAPVPQMTFASQTIDNERDGERERERERERKPDLADICPSDSGDIGHISSVSIDLVSSTGIVYPASRALAPQLSMWPYVNVPVAQPGPSYVWKVKHANQPSNHQMEPDRERETKNEQKNTEDSNSD